MKNLLKKLAIIFGALFVVFIGFSIYIKDIPFIGEIRISGQSMTPTINDGEWALLNIYSKPKINDVISFNCLSEKCMNGDENGGRIKRLTAINDQNCFYVLGDNRKYSNDSDDYGWLCPGDIKLDGVVFYHF